MKIKLDEVPKEVFDVSIYRWHDKLVAFIVRILTGKKVFGFYKWDR